MAVVLSEWREQGVVRGLSKMAAIQRGRELVVVGTEVRVRVMHGQVPVAECCAQHTSCVTQLWRGEGMLGGSPTPWWHTQVQARWDELRITKM